jgi:hypothetical protein
LIKSKITFEKIGYLIMAARRIYPELVRLVQERIENEDEEPTTIQRGRRSLCLVVDIEDFLDEGVIRVEYVLRDGGEFRQGWFILEDSFITKDRILLENLFYLDNNIHSVMAMFFGASFCFRPEDEVPFGPEYETADS